jgi:DNA-binding MarR family transcriptional regulator
MDDLHKAFESRFRLGVMSALLVNNAVDFTTLRNLLDVTDGNLATHLKALEKEGFILVEKSFVGRKPNTSYSVTEKGKKAFESHLKALEAMIKGLNR